MIKSINIIQYRKLKDLNLSFSKNVNAISGTNGTCKTSLLHIVGNSLQAPNQKCEWINGAKKAKEYITTAIRHSLAIGGGAGPTNHFYDLYRKAGIKV